MSLFGRRDEMPNGSMLSGPASFVMPSVTPATKPIVAPAPEVVVNSVEETEEEHHEEPETPVQAAPVQEKEEVAETVTVDTAPIPVQVSPLLYDERLHIKYMFTFYSGPFQVFVWIVAAVIVVPMILGMFQELQQEWIKLEQLPVIGIIARAARLIVVSIVEAVWGATVSLVESTGAVGVTIAVGAVMIAVAVLAILVIRPIYAWRVSRVQVGFNEAVLLKPGNKYLFLDDHTIRISDTSIIRGATEEVLAFDRWIFPGAGIVTIDKDDLGGRGDDAPWEPVREYEELVKAVKTVIAYHKSPTNRP